MIKPVKALFPDDNPLSPKIIECFAEIDDETKTFVKWIFPKGTKTEDIFFFLEFTSDPRCRMMILGYEPNK